MTVDVVIPVLNEAHVLAKSVGTVRQFVQGDRRYVWRIVVVDNGSTDGTQDVARRLSQAYPEVSFLHLIEKGRGRALRYAWMQSSSDIVCYTDVDLSTDLKHLTELVDAIAVEGYDIAIGSRLMRGSVTRRCLKRELTSRAYNILLKLALGVRFTDAQCGFKAVSRNAIVALVPHVKDESWFFDTELLVQAERQGRRIKEVPVVWIEDDDSRVKIFKTAWDDIKGVFRLWRHADSGIPRQEAASAGPAAQDARPRM